MTNNNSLASEESKLLSILKSERFQKMEGLINELPFFIYAYSPSNEKEIAGMRKRLKNQLSNNAITVLDIDLFELVITTLSKQDRLQQILDIEKDLEDKVAFQELIAGLANPTDQLKDEITNRIQENNPDVVFLSNVGSCYPFVRTHSVLNSLHSVVTEQPLLVFFPGSYELRSNKGSSLVLFGDVFDDQYYRAKNILDQEI